MKVTNRGLIAAAALSVTILVLAGAWIITRNDADSGAPASVPLVTARESTPGQDRTDDAEIMALLNVKLSEAPEGLRELIRQEWRTRASDCTQGNAVTDRDGKIIDPEVRYVANGYAQTDISCGDSITMLAARSDAGWDKVDTAKRQFSCDKLRYYKVPSAFLQKISSDEDAKVKCLPSGDGAAPVEYVL